MWVFRVHVGSTGNPDLEHNFNELVRMQAQLGSVSTDQSKDLAECSSLRAENERCESEVRNFKERESLKLKIQLLEKKKTWLVYKEELDQFKAAQQRSNEIKRRYDEAAAKFAPLEQKIIKKENLIVKTQAALTDKVIPTASWSTRTRPIGFHQGNFNDLRTDLTCIHLELSKTQGNLVKPSKTQ